MRVIMSLFSCNSVYYSNARKLLFYCYRVWRHRDFAVIDTICRYVVLLRYRIFFCQNWLIKRYKRISNAIIVN